MPENNAIFAALVAAQQGFKTPIKNKTNPLYGSRYADIQAIIDAVRPALNAQGLFLYQTVETDEQGWLLVETIITYKNGETLSSGKLRVPVSPGKNPIQSLGSAETYARRYSLSAFLGIAAEDDDDGNAAGAGNKPAQQQKRPEALTEAQKQAFRSAADEGLQTFREYFSTRAPEERRSFNADRDFSEECRARSADADKRIAGGAQ